MNTLEIKYNHKIKSFEDLYKYANKQFIDYEKLEGIDDWKAYDFSIDCSEDQMKFKDMLQIRCIEELTEATHALDNEAHFWEEITDAINFFLSSYCMLGVDFKEFTPVNEILDKFGERSFERITYGLCSKLFYDIINDIGDLCNLLKNRPWAQSNYLVSMYDFNLKLKILWNSFWERIGCLGLKEKKLFELFERKYEVNKWRRITGY